MQQYNRSCAGVINKGKNIDAILVIKLVKSKSSEQDDVILEISKP